MDCAKTLGQLIPGRTAPMLVLAIAMALPVVVLASPVASADDSHASLADLSETLTGRWAWSTEKSERVARNASLDKAVAGLPPKTATPLREDLSHRTAIAPVAEASIAGDVLTIRLDGPEGPRHYSAPFHGEAAAAHLEATRRGDGIGLVSKEHGGRHKVMLRPSTTGETLQLVEVISEPGLTAAARVVLTYRRQR